MSKFTEEILDVNEETYQKLVDLAKSRNESIDDTVNFILRNFIEENKIVVLTRPQFAAILNGSSDDSIFDKNYYITSEDGKIVAICTSDYVKNIQ
jgi:hypothetical protein